MYIHIYICVCVSIYIYIVISGRSHQPGPQFLFTPGLEFPKIQPQGRCFIEPLKLPMSGCPTISGKAPPAICMKGAPEAEVQRMDTWLIIPRIHESHGSVIMSYFEKNMSLDAMITELFLGVVGFKNDKHEKT